MATDNHRSYLARGANSGTEHTWLVLIARTGDLLSADRCPEALTHLHGRNDRLSSPVCRTDSPPVFDLMKRFCDSAWRQPPCLPSSSTMIRCRSVWSLFLSRPVLRVAI